MTESRSQPAVEEQYETSLLWTRRLHTDRLGEKLCLIVYQETSDSDRLEIRSLGAFERQCTIVLADWRAGPSDDGKTLLGGSEVLVVARDAKFLHPGVKRRPLDSQARSRPIGAGDNPPGLFESLADVIALRVLQGNCSEGF